ncbi:MAG: hypothetical protein ACPGJS_01285 [Flammeovirgaceae bacterium]
MEPLSDKVIIYDSHCPLCHWYTGEFVKRGILDETGRMPFDCLTAAASQHIDEHKSRHEIPLIDLKGGKTLYGIDSLIYLLSKKFNFVGKLMSHRPLYSFFKGLYAVISYNRRIISGADKRKEQYTCEPDFNLKFRIIFIAFAFVVASYVAMGFGNALAEFLPEKYQYFASTRMFLITSTGWIISAGISYFFLNFRIWVDYLGHLATIMLIGVLMFLPWLLLSKLFSGVYPITLLIGMFISLVFMAIQHKKRVSVLQIGQRWTLVWILSLLSGAISWGYFFFG